LFYLNHGLIPMGVSNVGGRSPFNWMVVTCLSG
jgi:hypothetical protein